MIAIAATLQPTDAPQLLGVILERLRTRFPLLHTRDDSTVVQMPAVGRVLITEARSSMQLDFVVDNEVDAAVAVDALEDEIRTQVRDRDISLRWHRPTIVPVALR
ncbi:hypothetical protein B0I08_104167 [Glaciihabitans tibetensis]|uniref:DUF2218 domain-containing protein n=1 Tax=Glaciihabitans tibetensis TaxID=1266600 RepID=A0A2T0VE66_9MICO|nr:hypothetical protein [Glaciihabitans tibetensis]PRY68465.1 hypothetical protein B0I08_104167 [Glaciihabitans tibetensis]